MLATNLVKLHRRDDPRHEIRELWIYTLISPCQLWASIRFLEDEHVCKRTKLALGTFRDMEAKHAEILAQWQEEGFAICEPSFPPI